VHQTPRLDERASFSDRDAYRDVLTEAYGEGRLDDETFARRSAVLEDSVTFAQLEELIADLPRGDIPVPQGTFESRRDDVGRLTAGVRERARARGEEKRRSRRGTLVATACLVGGSLVAGGIIGAVDVNASSYSNGTAQTRDQWQEQEQEEQQRYYEAANISKVRDALVKTHKQASQIDFDGRFAGAKLRTSPSSRKYDELQFGDDPSSFESKPGGIEESDRDVFFDPSTIEPEAIQGMVRTASEMTDGRKVQSVIITVGALDYVQQQPGKPVVTVSVEGDEYGSGATRYTWTPDGNALLSKQVSGKDS